MKRGILSKLDSTVGLQTHKNLIAASVNWCQSECRLTTATSNVQQNNLPIVKSYWLNILLCLNVKHGLIGCDFVTVSEDRKMTWQSKVAVCHIYCLSLSSTSFTHFLFLGCLSFPLLLKNFLSLNISWQMCWRWLYACSTLGPQVPELSLRTFLCVCLWECVTVSDVQVCELRTATHTVNTLPPPQAQRLLQAAQETTTNATSPQMGGGTRELECCLGPWNRQISQL